MAKLAGKVHGVVVQMWVNDGFCSNSHWKAAATASASYATKSTYTDKSLVLIFKLGFGQLFRWQWTSALVYADRSQALVHQIGEASEPPSRTTGPW